MMVACAAEQHHHYP